MKILNFGSLNIDHVYQVNHFVEAGETLSSDNLKYFCGGKGLNQSIAIAKAGAPVFHAGKIGFNGKMLLDALNNSGVDSRNVEQSESVTGHAIIQVDKTGQNCILLYGGTNFEMDNDFIDGVLAQFARNDILLLQNEINSIPNIMEKAHERKMQIAFNPSPYHQSICNYPLEFVKWFFLNEIEGKALTNQTEPEKIADSILSKYPDSAVILTLGKQGVYYKDAQTSAAHGIYAVERVDTTGAGDTFTGYFLAGIYQRLAIQEILRRASIASSIAVSRSGASSSIPEVKEVLDSHYQYIPYR